MGKMTLPLVETQELVELWLHGRSPDSAALYRQYAKRFLAHAGKPLPEVTLGDLQSWQFTLSGMSLSGQRTALAVIRSLLSFSYKLGVLDVNVGELMRLPKPEDHLSEKILSMAQVQALIEEEPKLRNRVILRLLYSAGLRVSELCALRWRDTKERSKGGQVTVYGKGNQTRVIVISAKVWSEVLSLRGKAERDDPVFRSRERSKNDSWHLSRKQVYRIVRAAGKRAGIEGTVSPHWLRHSHASHSLEKGAPIHLVQQTLGHSNISITERYLHANPDDSSALYLD